MYDPSQYEAERQMVDSVIDDPAVENGTMSLHDGMIAHFGEKGVAALDALDSEFTADAIERRLRSAAEAQIDRKPGATVKLNDRAEAMKRFVGAVNTINKAKGAGAASSTPGSDFRTRYADPTKVADNMENKAILAEHDADIGRRILTGEAALLSAGFDDTYAMAARVAVRKELEPLWKTGSVAQKERIDAVTKTRFPRIETDI